MDSGGLYDKLVFDASQRKGIHRIHRVPVLFWTGLFFTSLIKQEEITQCFPVVVKMFFHVSYCFFYEIIVLLTTLNRFVYES